ncbi:tyrosinase-like [Bufo bufo]|uniref:tyrosinase-like n=1 Tax=Bufo bufo TaxID=8384 RepID=UPI001ABDAE1A|nr:tyrosinase-like [Bufo bufo]
MLFLSVFLLSLVATDAAMFPKACITPGNNDFPVPCCPMYKGTPCGSGENRGSCVSTSLSRSLPPPDNPNDDRQNFPGYYFSSVCQCKDNFGGINCGGCAGNRWGDNCEKIKDLERQEIREKSETEQKRYMVWLNFCKKKMDPDYYILRAGDRLRSGTYEFLNASYYEVWTFNHYYASKAFINNTRETRSFTFGEGSTGYLSFNRMSLLFLENQMQKCTKDPSFALAYYDWRSDKHCAMCNNDLLGANDDQGYLHPYSAFSKWTMICADFDYPTTYCLMSDNICERPKIRRQPGAVLGSVKATGEDVENCLSQPYVDTPPYNMDSVGSARNCIEVNIDATMSRFFGGTMNEHPIASNDPLFTFHRGLIDKLFEKYILKWGLNKSSYPDNPIYGHGPYDCIMPFYQCTRNREMFVPSTTLGYHYSTYNGF